KVDIPQTGDKDLPPGTNFEIPKDRVPEGWTVTVDPDGKVSVTPPADVTPGTKVDIPQTGDKDLPPGTNFEIPKDRV
ncbi:YPDG domain-containing protein, partial [Staphylococcus aureus]